MGVGSRDMSNIELGDDLGLAALFGPDARIRPRRVYQADHRHVELGGQPHLGHRLAIALGMGAAEEARVALLERLALLVPDEHHPVRVQLGPAGADGAVVAEEPVAVQLDELVEDQLQVIGGHGPLGMPGHLDRLPGLQLAVDPLLQLRPFPPQPADFIAGLRVLLSGAFQLLDAGLQLVDRPLERQTVITLSHDRSPGPEARSGLVFLL